MKPPSTFGSQAYIDSLLRFDLLPFSVRNKKSNFNANRDRVLQPIDFKDFFNPRYPNREQKW
jgi:hypothetical protein